MQRHLFVMRHEEQKTVPLCKQVQRDKAPKKNSDYIIHIHSVRYCNFIGQPADIKKLEAVI